MKRFAQFNPFSGISGDMALAALIDAGASIEYVLAGLHELPLIPEGTTIVRDDVVRHAIRATRIEVVDADGRKVDRMMKQPGDEVRHGVEKLHHHDHDSDHAHEHVHSHSHSHPHPHPHPEDHHHHGDGSHTGDVDDHSEESKGYSDHHHHHVTFGSISSALDSSTLPERVRRRSIDIFREIARGEARVHGVDIDEVHFHEVGAVDSIADIVGVALALEDLEIDNVYATDVSLGSGGMIRSQHGMIPIPAPATLEILKGFPVVSTSIQSELTTPTGAGIVAGLSEGVGPAGSYSIRGTGFGGGTRDLAARPNILRVVIGEEADVSASSDSSGRGLSVEHDTVVLLEANVDDMSSEAWPLAIERLFNVGALDVWLTPTIMKKGRPGVILSVLTPPEILLSLEREIFRGTTSIGIRHASMKRSKLARQVISVETAIGVFRAKVVTTESGEDVRPEAEDVIAFARERDISFAEAGEVILREIARARSHKGVTTTEQSGDRK